MFGAERSTTARTLVVGLAHLGLPMLGTGMAVALAVPHGLTWAEPIAFFIMFVFAGLGLEVGYHRLLSHRAFVAHPLLQALLVVGGHMMMQGPARYWATVHRLHHRFADDRRDPHSPFDEDGQVSVRSVLHAHVLWILRPHFSAESFLHEDDLFSDRALRWIDRRYAYFAALGFVGPGLVAGLVFFDAELGLRVFFAAGPVRVFVSQQLVGSVNSLCHLFGSRPFRTTDRSTNIGLLALPTFGGSYHNTHHAFPYTADNATSFGQLDLGASFIRLCERLGLASGLKSISPQARRQKSSAPSE